MIPKSRETVTQGGSVTPERFARIRAIFEAAVTRPAAERRVFVEGACVGDPALLHEVNAMLAADRDDDSPSSSAPEEGRFPAGTVLAGRYRILGLLGHGGMGEVYKAFDLILNQTVALKFLAPAHISEAALVRFRNEVRIARQVSHPNVCRVYDLGMVEGLHFLSMEYIDGEDLASLLRRIGRLPQDKAIEFTRKICAGLSAAHERGVLHRDLKPANIMIDGRGHVHITDFGLAGLAAEIPLSDLRSGTPAYMSPEQKAGKEVTTRSDIYSLGLVLHEMFTGKARHNTQSSPSELVKDLDPAIERLILRCLEEDPKRRPNSALNVAMALPGADPIAAALAAGETPSPEMVAASDEKQGLRPRAAIWCFVATLTCLTLYLFVSGRNTVLAKAPLEIPPEALAFQAQKLLTEFGYTDRPKAVAYGFSVIESGYLTWLQKHRPANDPALLASQQPPVIGFWYRQHSSDFLQDSLFGVGLGQGIYCALSYSSPANDEAGMIRMILDPGGRLFALEARPPAKSPQQPPATYDWSRVFAAAGLDATRFTPASPEKTPPTVADSRVAWTGSYGKARAEKLRVEAAAWQGRPVYFNISGDWDANESASVSPMLSFLPILISVGIFVGAAAVAWNNLRLGRGDRQGANKIAACAFVAVLCCWGLTAAHVASAREFRLLIAGLGFASFCAWTLWLFYIAIEPQVRRHWPDSLISWTRLQAGRSRDPLVASHVLIGVLAAMAVNLVWEGFAFLAAPVAGDVLYLRNIAFTVSRWLYAPVYGSFYCIGYLVLVVAFRLLIRRIWIADSVVALLFGLTQIGYPGNNVAIRVLSVVVMALTGYSFLWLLRRFGLLAAAFSGMLSQFLWHVPMTAGSWYAGRTLVSVGIPAAVALWALWMILSAQKPVSTESAA